VERRWAQPAIDTFVGQMILSAECVLPAAAVCVTRFDWQGVLLSHVWTHACAH
jgi:hypothetical protein